MLERLAQQTARRHVADKRNEICGIGKNRRHIFREMLSVWLARIVAKHLKRKHTNDVLVLVA
jgi:hypothetical protein